MSPARKVLMVCMGNICRSPTAEGVLRHKLNEAGLADIMVDSAGTSAYHVGAPPDHRSIKHARRRGYDLSALRARRVCEEDFERFDLILAMDWDNFALLEEKCPAEHRSKLKRLTEFACRHDSPVVPDPYYSGADGFERVLDLIEDACDGLVAHLKLG
jgi:protein-tyrosine phosphatase